MKGTYMKRNVITETYKDKQFLKTAASIAVPVTLQMVLTTVTNMVDTMMIGQLGTATISAVGLANKYFFVFALLVFGVHSGSGILIAQFFGSNDHYHIRKTFGMGLLINLIAATAYLLAARFDPQFVMGIFTESTESVPIGVRYLRIVCFCYPIFGFTSIMSSFLRSTRQVRVPVISSLVSIITNVFLNYCLIFGHFGFPEMGVEGAAIATVIARVAECLILVWFCFIRGKILPGKITDFFGWTKGFLKNFCSHSLPVIFNEMIWGLGTTLYFVAYGHIDDNAVAAVTISTTITDMLNTAGNGLSSAASVLLGNELGAGNLKKADDYAGKILVLGLTIGLACSGLLLLLRAPLLTMFSVSEEVRDSAMKCLTIYAIALPLVFVSLINIVGILRSGGDTKMCFLIDTAGVWFWAVPLAFLGSMVWKFPIHVIYGMVLTEEVIKSGTSFWRVSKRVWLRNLSKEV